MDNILLTINKLVIYYPWYMSVTAPCDHNFPAGQTHYVIIYRLRVRTDSLLVCRNSPLT